MGEWTTKNYNTQMDLTVEKARRKQSSSLNGLGACVYVDERCDDLFSNLTTLHYTIRSIITIIMKIYNNILVVRRWIAIW